MTNLEKALMETKPRADGSRCITIGLRDDLGLGYPFLAAHLRDGQIVVYLRSVPHMRAQLADWHEVADLDWRPA